ncbi:MAG TPA: hypothetical protein VF306_04300 [Pirellulales bacterium]
MIHFLLYLTAMMALAVLSGCQPVPSSATTDAAHTETEEPNDAPLGEAEVQLPADYPAAMRQIVEYRDAIRTAVESGDLEQAHHPLDEADVVLRRLPEIARDSGVPRRHWEQVVVASEDLNELWGEIHAAIDEHQAPDYSTRQKAIDDAVERLQSVPRETQVSQRKVPQEKP